MVVFCQLYQGAKLAVLMLYAFKFSTNNVINYYIIYLKLSHTQQGGAWDSQGAKGLSKIQPFEISKTKQKCIGLQILLDQADPHGAAPMIILVYVVHLAWGEGSNNF